MKGNRPYMNWKGEWKRKIGNCMLLNWIMKRFVHVYMVILDKAFLVNCVKYYLISFSGLGQGRSSQRAK